MMPYSIESFIKVRFDAIGTYIPFLVLGILNKYPCRFFLCSNPFQTQIENRLCHSHFTTKEWFYCTCLLLKLDCVNISTGIFLFFSQENCFENRIMFWRPSGLFKHSVWKRLQLIQWKWLSQKIYHIKQNTDLSITYSDIRNVSHIYNLIIIPPHSANRNTRTHRLLKFLF